MEGASVDLGRDDGDLGDHIEAILQGVGPIVILLHALLARVALLGAARGGRIRIQRMTNVCDLTGKK